MQMYFMHSEFAIHILYCVHVYTVVSIYPSCAVFSAYIVHIFCFDNFTYFLDINFKILHLKNLYFSLLPYAETRQQEISSVPNCHEDMLLSLYYSQEI